MLPSTGAQGLGRNVLTHAVRSTQCIGEPYPHYTARRVEQYLQWWQLSEPLIHFRFDGLFNAFHIETIPTLLPYIEDYDSQSVLYSQVLMIHMANIFYPNQVIQFNPLGWCTLLLLQVF